MLTYNSNSVKVNCQEIVTSIISQKNIRLFLFALQNPFYDNVTFL